VGAAQAQAAGDGIALIAELFHFGQHAGAVASLMSPWWLSTFETVVMDNAELAGDALHRGRVHAFLRKDTLTLKFLDFNGKG
jgi:hypothetical protein